MRTHDVMLVSNFRKLKEASSQDIVIHHEYTQDGSWEFIRRCLRADIVILNVDQRKLMLACLLKWVLPMLRFKLISVDLILRPPKSLSDRIKALSKRIMFSRVDRFILYFKDLTGYQKFYGIGAERAVYVPFKVNGWEYLSAVKSDATPEGDYVLCAGRTLRDIETFVRAMERIGCPGVLLQQQKEVLSAHGTAVWSGELPPNVRLIVDDSDSIQAFHEFIRRARLVVIPRFRGDIAATGISTYMIAMALQKCVVISSGPGAEDVLLSGQAVVVPAEDVETLAEQIALLWQDEAMRSEIASRGRRYAEQVGGEERLLMDILEAGTQFLDRRTE